MNSIKNERGFTLIELLLYIQLLAIFITGAIYFAWDVIYGSEKSAIEREVNQNMRFASKRIQYEIRNASGINSVSANSLCLSSSNNSHNPTLIYVSNGRLTVGWGGNTSDCTSMTNEQPLTSNNITVDDLTFSNNSSGTDSYNIGFTFTVSSTGTKNEWQKSEEYYGSVEMRSN